MGGVIRTALHVGIKEAIKDGIKTSSCDEKRRWPGQSAPVEQGGGGQSRMSSRSQGPGRAATTTRPTEFRSTSV